MSSNNVSTLNPNLNLNSTITLKFIPPPPLESSESEYATLQFYQANPNYGPFCNELGPVPSEATLHHQLNSLTLSTLLNEYQRIASFFLKPPPADYLEVPDVVTGFNTPTFGSSASSTAYKIRLNIRAGEKSVDGFLERFPYILHRVYYPVDSIWKSKTPCKTVEIWSKAKYFKSGSDKSNSDEWYETAVHAQILRTVIKLYKSWESFSRQLYIDFEYNDEMAEYAKKVKSALWHKDRKPSPPPERPIRPRSGVSRSNSQEEKLWKYSLWRAFCSYPIPVEELVLPTTSTTSTFFSLFSRKVSEAKAFTQIRTPLTSLSFSNSIPLNSSHQAGVDLLSFISSSSLDPSKVSPSNSNGSLELNVKQFDDESRFEESILVDVTEEQGAEDDELESSLRLLPNNILRSDNS